MPNSLAAETSWVVHFGRLAARTRGKHKAKVFQGALGVRRSDAAELRSRILEAAVADQHLRKDDNDKEFGDK